MPKARCKRYDELSVSGKWRFHRREQARLLQPSRELASAGEASQATPLNESSLPSLHHPETPLGPAGPVPLFQHSPSTQSFEPLELCSLADQSSDLPVQVLDIPTSQAFSLAPDMREVIAGWALNERNVPMDSISRLLRSLQQIDPTLPSSAKTLFPDPNLSFEAMEGGEYVHLPNWTKSLADLLVNNLDTTSAVSYQLLVNIDGLPLFKGSPNFKTYPILVSVYQIQSRPICAGIYCSNKSTLREMPSPNIFLRRFLADLEQLVRDPLIINGCSIKLEGRGTFVCDAPARASLKLVKSHSGYSSCERCIVRGEYHGQRVCLLGTTYAKRTDTNFGTQLDMQHHHGRSVLADFGVNMVSDFPLDYMHLTCLGVCRRLILWWKGTRRQLQAKLSPRSILKLSRQITSIKSLIPIEFNRKMRPLSEILYWKAAEFRLFMLYCGVVILKDVEILSRPRYAHFLNFAVGMRLLLMPNITPLLLQKAKELLNSFVESCVAEYGQAFVSYNVHSIMHLADDYDKFGQLDNISCFPFESYLGVLKSSLKGRFKPLQQIAKYAFHQNQNSVATANASRKSSDVVDTKNKGVSPSQYLGMKQYRRISIRPGMTIKRDSECDGVISLYGAIAKVVNIFDSNGKKLLLVKVYTRTSNFFELPIPSSKVGIFAVSQLHDDFTVMECTKDIKKCMLLPYADHFVAIEFVH